MLRFIVILMLLAHPASWTWGAILLLALSLVCQTDYNGYKGVRITWPKKS